jgi:NADH:ubiquinone oxidoreductase subunit F (NADH-binding)
VTVSGAAAATPPAHGLPPAGALRLILRDGALSLAEHTDAYGPLPRQDGRLIAELERSGLTGRGGGAFPAGRKLRAVAKASTRRGQSAPVIVANGSESEPASSKDLILLSHSPHLVIDGMVACADAVGARRGYLCVGHRTARLAPALTDAIAERARAGRHQAGGSTLAIEVARVPDGYLSGQETALIATLNGGRPLPTFVPPRPSDRGVRRQPTLVQNVETLAHVGLIARYGSPWFRQVGTRSAPGTALVTLTGAVSRPGVWEIPLGTPLTEVLDRAGLAERPAAVLTGGYFGTWLGLPGVATADVSEPGLRAAGAALGAGVLAVLPESACGLAETARVTAYLASQNARQCGPCSNGLPALAEAMKWIAFGEPGHDAAAWVHRLTRLVAGRGACHLPDGGAALINSALAVFADDLRAHATWGPCERVGRQPVLPIPLAASR